MSSPSGFTVGEMIQSLSDYDPALPLEIIAPGNLTVGSIYDDTDPLFHPDVKPDAKATLVTIELDAGPKE